jgi:hypothetical protein
VTIAAAEVVDNNDNKQESNGAKVTAANDNSISNSGSRGDDDNGGIGESKGGKKITIH